MKTTALFFFLTAVLLGCHSPRTNKGAAGAAADNPRNLQQLVFGRYCGMCQNDCAVMYQVDLQEGRLFADRTDSYRKDEGRNLTFPSQSEGAGKYEIAKRVVPVIPDSLFLAPDSARFGCPDCADGCGLFVQLHSPEGKKHFYIDYQTENLEGYIRPFAETLKRTIAELEKE